MNRYDKLNYQIGLLESEIHWMKNSIKILNDSVFIESGTNEDDYFVVKGNTATKKILEHLGLVFEEVPETERTVKLVKQK